MHSLKQELDYPVKHQTGSISYSYYKKNQTILASKF